MVVDGYELLWPVARGCLWLLTLGSWLLGAGLKRVTAKR
jgi:hypothetical protein